MRAGMEKHMHYCTQTHDDDMENENQIASHDGYVLLLKHDFFNGILYFHRVLWWSVLITLVEGWIECHVSQ